MKILLLANGDATNIKYSYFDKIVCVDGGLNSLPVAITPYAIIGDFDSINKSLLQHFKEKSNIIVKNNQDESDLHFALKYCLTLEPKEINIINAVSTSRFDHSVCNVLLLEKIPKHISAKIITPTQEIFLIRDSVKLIGLTNRLLSLIPLTNCTGIKTQGLQWEINEDLSYGFVNGISNVIKNETATISIKTGSLLCILER